MSFSQDQGYIPTTVADLMALVRAGINTQFGTSYDTETFLGTAFYKYFYALIQRLQENEVKTSEIVLKLQNYFAVTNEVLFRPNTTAPGIVDYFRSFGYTVSIKAPIVGDAGKLYVCALVDSGAGDYATTKLAINTILKNCVVAGVITQGTETSSIVLSNDQSFDFKFNLPSKTAIKLKLTIALSANNEVVIPSDATVKALLLANMNARYTLGKNFEPQRYFSVVDAPWAASVLLQYSTDGGSTWLSAVVSQAYDALYTFALADITIVNT